MKALRFRHEGVDVAIPPAQVLRGAEAPDGPVVSLFGPGAEVDPADTWLEVSLDGSPRWIGVRDLDLADVEAPAELSGVAAGVMNLPHVVGWVEDAERWVWLVDLRRYRPQPASR